MYASEFDFKLPPSLIAQHPPDRRTDSRLLLVGADYLKDYKFTDLPKLISSQDLLVFNNSKTINARLTGKKETGGAFEILVERLINKYQMLVQIKMSHTPRTGMLLKWSKSGTAIVGLQEGSFWNVLCHEPVFSVLEREGTIPLPPYITRPANQEDCSRYQTVYGRYPGSVAAPTAGLHFDEELISKLQKAKIQSAFVTLHIGAGTFKPIRSEFITDHKMHKEVFYIPPETIRAIEETKIRGGKIVAVGTTALRALESGALHNKSLVSGAGETDLFIKPGYQFKVVQKLITNFHLPRSTLLVLVHAFSGSKRISQAYKHAIEHNYRFFSYGDALLLENQTET